MVPTTLINRIEENPFLMELSSLFNRNQFSFYLVGGAVRDFILDIDTKDFDFTTNATPEESKKLLEDNNYKTTSIGIKYGTIETSLGDLTVHITQFRSDTYNENSRKPEITDSKDINEDLIRRDFTVNAIAFDIEKNELIDPHNGLKDLSEGKLKTPDNPNKSFSDDPLRMIRLCRFISTHGFAPDNETFKSIQQNIERVEIVSKERIRDEFSKLVTGDNVAMGIQALVESNLIDYIIPEIRDLKIEVDPNHHHKDVYEHTLQVTSKVSPDLTLRLGALLHDIAKPATKGIDNGKVHFRHHEVVGARMTKEILSKLKYPKKIISSVALLVENHLRPHTYKMGWTDSAVRRYIIDAGVVLDELNELVRCDVTTKNNEKAETIYKYLDDLEKRIKEVKEKEELKKLRPPVDGNEIMKILKIEPGPSLGKIMESLYEQRINEGEVSKEEAIKLAKEVYKKL
ncbi:CCA tRNA nucleotidyltransferase [Acidimicrobiaceae bacterium]|nr:CCA tRNA nucleotidyltransferase [Acidimicrobiaceae bacterium]